ncbi:hypothetical protein MIR68_002771 [Amoeboaphelidium protococcarum]|nr:hypothetical protein MIR68_002771 [Amoeboaphelidium protococcarum]
MDQLTDLIRDRILNTFDSFVVFFESVLDELLSGQYRLVSELLQIHAAEWIDYLDMQSVQSHLQGLEKKFDMAAQLDDQYGLSFLSDQVETFLYDAMTEYLLTLIGTSVVVDVGNGLDNVTALNMNDANNATTGGRAILTHLFGLVKFYYAVYIYALKSDRVSQSVAVALQVDVLSRLQKVKLQYLLCVLSVELKDQRLLSLADNDRLCHPLAMLKFMPEDLDQQIVLFSQHYYQNCTQNNNDNTEEQQATQSGGDALKRVLTFLNGRELPDKEHVFVQQKIVELESSVTDQQQLQSLCSCADYALQCALRDAEQVQSKDLDMIYSLMFTLDIKLRQFSVAFNSLCQLQDRSVKIAHMKKLVKLMLKEERDQEMVQFNFASAGLEIQFLKYLKDKQEWLPMYDFYSLHNLHDSAAQCIINFAYSQPCSLKSLVQYQQMALDELELVDQEQNAIVCLNDGSDLARIISKKQLREMVLINQCKLALHQKVPTFDVRMKLKTENLVKLLKNAGLKELSAELAQLVNGG